MKEEEQRRETKKKGERMRRWRQWQLWITSVTVHRDHITCFCSDTLNPWVVETIE